MRVAKDPLGEPGHTPLYVGLPSTWGSVDGDHIFSLFFVGWLLIGDSDIMNELMNGRLCIGDSDITNELMNGGLHIGDSDKYSE
jgi:hypothetical protein